MSKTRRIKITGEGPPVLFIHGTLGNKSQWKVLANYFTKKYTVICIDLCGYGADVNSSYGIDHKLESEVLSIERLLSEVGISDLENNKLRIVAHSFGASVALKFSQMHSERIHKQVLYEPVSIHLLQKDKQFDEIESSAERIFGRLDSGCKMEAVQEFAEYWGGNSYWKNMSEFHKFMLSNSVKKVRQDYHSILYDELTIEELQTITNKTFILYGRNCKQPIRKIAEVLQNKIPNIKSVTINDGHFGFIENQQRYINIVEDFLEG